MAVRVSRILHAGYIFEHGGSRIVFDPIFENPFSRNCHAFPKVRFDRAAIKKENFDAVFISHHHDDHFSLESLDLLNRATPLYMFAVHDELFDLIRDLGFTNVFSLTLDRPVPIGPFTVVPRRALDADVDSLLQIKVDGFNILNVVDSWIDYDTLDLLAREKPWDLVLWPFQTMRELEILTPTRAPPAARDLPPEWIDQLKILNPRHIVPSSCQFQMEEWSWYNKKFFPITYARFQEEIAAELPETRVLRLDPSETVGLQGTSASTLAPLPWITRESTATEDYDYDDNFPAPSTAEISRRLPPASPEDLSATDTYLRLRLPEIYKTLEHEDDAYFSRPRRWKLSLYDKDGNAMEYYYRIGESTAEMSPLLPDDVEWWTEVPAVKVAAALNSGESLTSMYVRINDATFSPEVEAELKDSNVLEDPLIRCLFRGSIGAYQKDQLRRLKNSKS